MELLQAALAQGVAPAIVVAIYLVIIKILDNRKDKNQVKISNELTQSISLISKYIIDMSKSVLDNDKEKCKIAITDAMSSYSLHLIQFVQLTLINNHIDTNKENILSNIHNIVSSEYYNVFATLSLYTINNKKVSDYLDTEWMKDIETDIVNIIYSATLNKEDKLNVFVNKIDIKFQSYIVYITNKALK